MYLFIFYSRPLHLHFSPIFKWSLLGWHGLITLCRVQVYSSVLHHLYIMLCAHRPKSNRPPSPCTWPPSPFLPPVLLPCPSGNHHTAVCVYEFLFVCFSCLFICCFSFVSHMWVKSYASWLFLSDLFCLAQYTQGPSVLSQVAVFHLFLATVDAAMNTGVHISLWTDVSNFCG